MITVYIWLCTDGTTYTGLTNNIIRRTLEHMYKPSHYMRDHRLQRLLYCHHCPDRHTAALLERSIKKHGAKRFIRKLYADNALPSPV